MAPHSSTLAWKIPWTEEPGGPQSMGSLRVGQDSATSLSLFTFLHWRRQWQPTPMFLPGKSQDGGASWAAVFGVSQNRTQLKRLSSSSSSSSICLKVFEWLRIIKYNSPIGTCQESVYSFGRYVQTNMFSFQVNKCWHCWILHFLLISFLKLLSIQKLA